ncbi:helix-turn-helix transcriptional regulator [Nocardioides insulae]|uniref:helix-turn-helix transcriptional regulator n=1 Tax=Nocardioides insulae TaxID=394734 RepID=UPI00040AFE36|nr:AraC family transcriptional regulator [Nocardioides insulae]
MFLDPGGSSVGGAASTAAAVEPAFGAWGHDPHVHDCHLLLYTPIGHAVVEAEGVAHHLSATVALWLPAGVWHSARFDADCLVEAVPFDVVRFPRPPEPARQLLVGEDRRRLLLAWLRTAGRRPRLPSGLYDAFLGDPPEQAGLPLPDPQSPAVCEVAAGLRDRPCDQRTAQEWADSLFVSSTTLRRGFVAETGLTFSEWRTRARLNASLPLLASGLLVSAVAHRVGFASANGYILAFRTRFGQTPKAFATDRRALSPWRGV